MWIDFTATDGKHTLFRKEALILEELTLNGKNLDSCELFIIHHCTSSIVYEIMFLHNQQ